MEPQIEEARRNSANGCESGPLMNGAVERPSSSPAAGFLHPTATPKASQVRLPSVMSTELWER
jgi:hypothetical protein